ncbi:MAG: hypothetical protein RL745_423 [Actinomycetota bacterium]|jgi:hypothetical protein
MHAAALRVIKCRRGRRLRVALAAMALIMGGGITAYSAVLGSPEYRLGIAAANTFAKSGYNVTLSTQVSPGYMAAVAQGTDFASLGLPGIQNPVTAARAISSVSITMARGTNDVLNPNARFAIAYGKSTVLDMRIVKRTAYLRINPAALANERPIVLPKGAIKAMGQQLRASVAKANKAKGISPATKAFNSRALDLYDGSTVAMNFASNTAAGRKWNRLVRPATNPQLQPVQQATATLMQALRENLAGNTTVVDLDDDAIGDKMSVSVDVPGLLTAMKPQLLELAHQQAIAAGQEWDGDAEALDFDQSISEFPTPLTADVWISGDYIKQLEFDLSQLNSPPDAESLPAKGLVLRMIFNRGVVTAPTKIVRMSAAESSIAMNKMGASAFGFLAAANSGVPLPVRRPGTDGSLVMPSMSELADHTAARALVWQGAMMGFIAP